MRALARAGVVMMLSLGTLAIETGGAEARAPRTLVVGTKSATCLHPTYRDVDRAILKARAGDTVWLCAGTYCAPVKVTKAITLQGPSAALSPSECQAVTSSNATTQAVLTGGITVAADRVVLRGLVVDSVVTGITTTAAISGYRLTANLLRGAGYLGIEAESNGLLPSRIDHNCVRDKTGGAIVSEDGPLQLVSIDANTTTGNNESVTALGEYAHDRILIARNISLGDTYGIAITSSTHSALIGNRIDGLGTTLRGFQILGGNVGLVIAGNDSGHNGYGLVFDRTGANFIDPRPSTQLLISTNTFHDNSFVGFGVLVPSGGPSNQVTHSLITHNTFRNNVFSGFVIAPGDDNNILYGNTSIDNGRNGIRLAGSTGTVVAGNTMTGNAVFDAVDDSSPLGNRWAGNTCVTDNPDGLCANPPGNVAAQRQSRRAAPPVPAADLPPLA